MIPPKFGDIGKSASDLLSKDYPVGVAKLEVKTTTDNGVTFTVNGNQDVKSGGIVGELKAKYAVKSKGLSITPSWTTSNVLNADVEVVDTLVKGLKLTANGSLLPAGNTKNVKVGVEYKQNYVFTNSSLDLFKGPTVSADASFGVEGVVVGGDVAYNVKDGKVSKYSSAIGYSAADYAVSIHALSNFKTFSASFFRRVNEQVDIGARAVMEYKSASPNGALEVGTKYTLDNDTFLKAKINHVGVLGLGFSQVLRPGIKLGLGGSFDTARFGENAHKLGVSFTFEA